MYEYDDDRDTVWKNFVHCVRQKKVVFWLQFIIISLLYKTTIAHSCFKSTKLLLPILVQNIQDLI